MRSLTLLLLPSVLLAPAAALGAPTDCVLQAIDAAGNASLTGATGFSFGGERWVIVSKPVGSYVNYAWTGDPYSEDTMRCSLIWSPRSNFTDWLVSRMDADKTPPLKLNATLTTGGSQSTYAFDMTAPERIVFPGVSTDVLEERSVSVTLGYGAVQQTTTPPRRLGTKQKAWICSNFRFSIDGVDTSGVVSSEPLVWEPHKSPGLDMPEVQVFSPLVLTFTGDHSGGWADWFKSAGVLGDKGKREGTLEYLDKNGAVLLTLQLHNLGLYKVTPDKSEANSDTIKRVRAEMFVENVTPIYPSEG